MINWIISFLYYICSFFCHQLPERSFYIAGFKLPVCSRCTGVYIGAFFAYLALPFIFKCSKKTIGVLDTILFTAPLAIDGVLQLYGLSWRNNWTRFITGVLASSSTVFFTVPLFLSLLEKIDIEVKVHDYCWLKILTVNCTLVLLFSLSLILAAMALNNFICFITLSMFLAYYVILHNIIAPVAVVVILVFYV